MTSKSFISILFIILIACSNHQNKEQPKEADSKKVISNEKISNSIGEVLISEALTLTEDWQEYKVMDELISDYYNITPNDAINNAQSLADAALLLKDSIRVEKLKIPEIKIRLNVLYNNILNLSSANDVTLKNEELLKHNISNVLESFSAVNSKINNLIKQEILEKELKNFND